MKNLIKKILKEEFDNFEWTEELFNQPIDIETYDIEVGKKIMFVPTEDSDYRDKYSKCIGQISDVQEIPYSEDGGWTEDVIRRITISNIVCDPESYKYQNNRYVWTEYDEWETEHEFYLIP